MVPQPSRGASGEPDRSSGSAAKIRFAIGSTMNRMQKDDILGQLVFSDELVEAYARPERERTEPAGDHWTRPVVAGTGCLSAQACTFQRGRGQRYDPDFPGYSILLTTLLRSGDAVADAKHGYAFLVLDGSATVVTGGQVERARTIAGR